MAGKRGGWGVPHTLNPVVRSNKRQQAFRDTRVCPRNHTTEESCMSHVVEIFARLLCSTSLWSLYSIGSFTLLCSSAVYKTDCTDCAVHCLALFGDVEHKILVAGGGPGEGVGVVFVFRFLCGEMKLCCTVPLFSAQDVEISHPTHLLWTVRCSSHVYALLFGRGGSTNLLRVHRRAFWA